MTIQVVEGPVADVTIDIVRTRNALSSAVLEDLAKAIGRLSADGSTRAIVLSGAGGGFSSGADLREEVPPDRTAVLVGALYEAIVTAPTPVIARVEGYCLGLAVGVVAACDLVVAADSTAFSLPEPRFGQAPTLAAVPILRRLAAGPARRMMLTAERFDGRRAHAVGLVDECAPDDRVGEVVDRWTEGIVAGAPGALGVCKRLVNELPRLAPSDAWALAVDLTAERAFSDEAKEGSAAAAERRLPVWHIGSEK